MKRITLTLSLVLDGSRGVLTVRDEVGRAIEKLQGIEAFSIKYNPEEESDVQGRVDGPGDVGSIAGTRGRDSRRERTGSVSGDEAPAQERLGPDGAPEGVGRPDVQKQGHPTPLQRELDEQRQGAPRQAAEAVLVGEGPTAQAPQVIEGTTAVVENDGSYEADRIHLLGSPLYKWGYKVGYHGGRWYWKLVNGGGIVMPHDLNDWLTRAVLGLDNSSFMGVKLISHSAPIINPESSLGSAQDKEQQKKCAFRNLLDRRSQDIDEGRIASFDKLGTARQARAQQSIDEGARDKEAGWDEKWKARVEQITDPMDMLKEMIDGIHAGFLGVPDPYYRDLYTCLLKQAEKVIER